MELQKTTWKKNLLSKVTRIHVIVLPSFKKKVLTAAKRCVCELRLPLLPIQAADGAVQTS